MFLLLYVKNAESSGGGRWVIYLIILQPTKSTLPHPSTHSTT